MDICRIGPKPHQPSRTKLHAKTGQEQSCMQKQGTTEAELSQPFDAIYQLDRPLKKDITKDTSYCSCSSSSAACVVW